MRPIKALALIASLSLGLAGCESPQWLASSAIDKAPPSPDRPWTPPTAPDGEILSGPAPAGAQATNYILPSNGAVATTAEDAAVDPRHVYALADLIDLGERKNPLTRAAWNLARDAALATGVARAAYMPNVIAAVTGVYQYSRGSDTLTVGPLAAPTAATPARVEGVISAVSMQWLLFDFGQRDAVARAADQVSIGANLGFTAAHQQLIFDISMAFYTYSAARA